MKRKKSKPKTVPLDAAWSPFGRCDTWRDALGNEVEIPPSVLILRNSIYTVDVSQCEAVVPFGEITWLSIKRNDRRPIHDWRDLQRIKNEICSPEREAVELYPAEARLTDTANQYHLWVFPDGYRLPFGYAERFVSDDMSIDPGTGLAPKQRPFRPGEAPPDLLSGGAALQRMNADPGFGARLVHKQRRVLWEAVIK